MSFDSKCADVKDCIRTDLRPRNLPRNLVVKQVDLLSKNYNNPEAPIEVKVNEFFKISLESNPSTGFTWDAEYDSSLIEEYQSKKFIPISEALGAGGKEQFEFESKKVGLTFIIMKYKRSWENEAPQKKLIFKVEVKE